MAEKIGVIVIHGVGTAEPGWINDFVVEPLKASAGGKAGLEFDTFCELHKLEDKVSDGGEPFVTHVRNAKMGDKTVAFIELLWADLGRVSPGLFGRFLAAMRLFFEAPQVLTDAMLKGNRGFFHGAVRWLILFINLWLRWAIAGLNIAALCCASTVYFLEPSFPGRLFEIIAITLVSSAVVFRFMGRRGDDRDLQLVEITNATALCSVLLLVLVTIDHLGLIGNALETRAEFLSAAAHVIYAPWYVWNFLLMGLIIIVALVAIKRLVLKPSAGSPRLQTLAASTAVIALQGMIWKIIVAAVWVFVIYHLVPQELGGQKLTDAKTWCQFETFEQLSKMDETPKKVACITLSISALNVLIVLEIILALAGVILWRRMARQGVAVGDVRKIIQPRLIVNRVIVTVILAGFTANFIAFYLPQIQVGPLKTLYGLVALFINAVGVNGLFGLGIFGGGFLTLLSIGRFLSDAFASPKERFGVMHIARDLVDHQYNRRLQPLRQLAFYRSDDARIEFSRRARIQRRLDVIIEEIVIKRAMKRLIFFTHSQGTMIAYDYLLSKNAAHVAGVDRIDIVTLASPLSHIHHHYYDDYRQVLPCLDKLHPSTQTWINMWRIDDPIGDRVDAVEGGIVYNERLGPGGHVNYWKEQRVCDVLVRLLKLEPIAVVEPAPSTQNVSVAESVVGLATTPQFAS